LVEQVHASSYSTYKMEKVDFIKLMIPTDEFHQKKSQEGDSSTYCNVYKVIT
jgi:hypothetical protein